ncbi:MAG: hypothetical protein LC808_17700, partial [Actinobacteria bacterium]|nr:hypothetical protein [Actinomycetota bacterium]
RHRATVAPHVASRQQIRPDKDDSRTRTFVRTARHAAEMTSSSGPCPLRVPAMAADVLEAGSLAARAAEVAARQRSPQTRRTYAAVYRSLGSI